MPVPNGVRSGGFFTFYFKSQKMEYFAVRVIFHLAVFANKHYPFSLALVACFVIVLSRFFLLPINFLNILKHLLMPL